MEAGRRAPPLAPEHARGPLEIRSVLGYFRVVSTWGERIEAARRDRIVPRRVEEARFAEFLDDASLRLFAIHGMPGSGKSTLLRRFEAMVDGPVQTLRAASRPPTREAWRDAFDPTARLIALDDVHRLAEILPYLVDTVLPTLRSHQQLVVAGSRPLPSRLLHDPGWSPLVETMVLGPLSRDEAQLLLARAGVPAPVRADLVELAAGHPLALQLIAERWDGFDWSRNHATRRAFLDHMLDGVPPAERRVLDVAALNPVVTPELLADLDTSLSDAFHSVAELPLATRAPGGLAVEPVLREPLAQELACSTPDLRDSLLRASLAHAESKSRVGPRERRVFWAGHSAELIGRAMRSHGPTALPGLTSGLARTEDVDEIAERIEARLGRQSAHIARRWLDRSPRGAHVAWHEGAVVAYVHFLDLDDARATEEDDPAAAAFLRHAQLTGASRARLARFYLPLGDNDGGLPFVMHETTARLLFGAGLDLACSAQPEWMVERYRELGAHPAVARFTLDGEAWSLRSEDLRKYTPADLVRIWNQLGRNDPSLLSGAAGGAEDGVFATAEEAYPELRRALRAYHDARRLARSPLARSPRVRARVASGEAPDPVDALRASLAVAVRELGVSGQDARSRRVIEASFFSEPRKQIAIARDLGMGESTYRRHLSTAIERLAEIWVAKGR